MTSRKEVKVYCLLLSLVLTLLIFSIAEGQELVNYAKSETFSKALEANLEIATYVCIARSGDGGYIFSKCSNPGISHSVVLPEDSLDATDTCLDENGYAIVKKVTSGETVRYYIYPRCQSYTPDGWGMACTVGARMVGCPEECMVVECMVEGCMVVCMEGLPLTVVSMGPQGIMQQDMAAYLLMAACLVD